MKDILKLYSVTTPETTGQSVPWQTSQNMDEKCCMSHRNMKDMNSKLYCWGTPWRHLSFFAFLSNFWGKKWTILWGMLTKTHLHLLWPPSSPTSEPHLSASRRYHTGCLALLCSKKILKNPAEKSTHKKMMVFKSSVLEKLKFLGLCVLKCICMFLVCNARFWIQVIQSWQRSGSTSYFEMLNAAS